MAICESFTLEILAIRMTLFNISNVMSKSEQIFGKTIDSRDMLSTFFPKSYCTIVTAINSTVKPVVKPSRKRQGKRKHKSFK